MIIYHIWAIKFTYMINGFASKRRDDAIYARYIQHNEFSFILKNRVAGRSQRSEYHNIHFFKYPWMFREAINICIQRYLIVLA